MYLSWDMPRRPVAGRQRFEIGPLGVDWFLVHATADYYRIELNEQRPVRLTVTELDETQPWVDWGWSAEVDKDSREPAAVVETGSRSTGWNVVSVRGEPGLPYVLQHFELRDRYTIDGSGSYWISTVHSGHAADSVAATGILAEWGSDRRVQPQPSREQTITIDHSTGWSARCNLLVNLTVFLDVRQGGRYMVESSGTEARFRIEPFLVEKPRDYQSPSFERAGVSWDLDAGFYVLEALPQKAGILEITVRSEDQAPLELSPSEPAVRFESVPLSDSHSYVLFLNRQPGVEVGVVVRPLPVDLSMPLPLSLMAGEEVSFSMRLVEDSVVRAVGENGELLDLSIGGGPWSKGPTAAPGQHEIVVRNTQDAATPCSVAAAPVRLEATTPLPPLPQASLDALPRLPELRIGEPVFFDLAKSGASTFLVTAPADALYSLETTGLIDTVGTLRSRTETSLAAAAGDGSGRNFALHQFLLGGDYQVTVTSRGQ